MMARLVLSAVMLTAVYALTLSSLDPWDLAIGAGIAVALLVLFRPVTVGHHAAHLPGLAGRLLAFFPFVAWVALDVVVSAWKVARVIVGIRTLRDAELVEVPIQGRSHRGIAVTALVTTLAPGSYFIGVDWERQVMLFHFLEARDPDAIRRSMAHSYERYQSRVFP
jgi:multisubunit Na+/H+ antiporter MnhE subunit